MDLIQLSYDFYDKTIINSYIDTPRCENITDFKSIDNNFKYWIIHIFLIIQIFNVKSDYDIFFNKNNFNKHINELLELSNKKNEEKKKDDKKKTKKKSGGGSDAQIKNLLKKRNKEKKGEQKKGEQKKGEQKKEEQKKIDIRIPYIKYMEITSFNNIELTNIYCSPFKKNMKIYFKNEIDTSFINPFFNPPLHAIPPPAGAILDLSNKKLENPFKKNSYLEWYKIINNSNKIKITSDNYETVLNENLKYDIFQFLEFFREQENMKEITNFIDNVKKKIILLLYYLYKIKKDLYVNYIDYIDTLFSLSNNSNNNTKSNNETNKSNKSNNKTNKSNKSNKSNNNKSTNSKSNKSNNDYNINLIEKDARIETLKKKISKIESSSKTPSEFNLNILALQNKIKKLIVENYEKK